MSRHLRCIFCPVILLSAWISQDCYHIFVSLTFSTLLFFFFFFGISSISLRIYKIIKVLLKKLNYCLLETINSDYFLL